MMMKRKLSLITLIIILVATTGVLSGCSGGDASHTEASHLPAFVQNAPPAVQTAYQYTVDHPHDLEAVPCYCGCGPMGHTSSLSCFVREYDESGTILAYDTHALGCGICVDIALDVKRLRSEGKSLPEVRTYVDAVYSSFGPGTDTPFPAGG
jgi:hypothetical protein